MDITKVYGTFISGSSPDGCTKKLSTFAEFFIAKKENAKPYRFAFFAWFINFYFTSNVKVISPEPNAWLSERHHWKLSLSKSPITNV